MKISLSLFLSHCLSEEAMSKLKKLQFFALPKGFRSLLTIARDTSSDKEKLMPALTLDLLCYQRGGLLT